MEQQQGRVRRRTGLAVEDVESFNLDGLVQNAPARLAVAPPGSCAAHKSSFCGFLNIRDFLQVLLKLLVSTDQTVHRMDGPEIQFLIIRGAVRTARGGPLRRAACVASGPCLRPEPDNRLKRSPAHPDLPGCSGAA